MTDRMKEIRLQGLIADPLTRRPYTGEVVIREGKIAQKREYLIGRPKCVITPGLIDAHVHIESSLLLPAQFARLAVRHGTVGTVSDPHEIANVLGVKGVRFMIENGKLVPFHFNFGAPSCVPATSFETAGARLGVKEIASLLRNKDVRFLCEVMNFPAVIAGDPFFTAIVGEAHRLGKRVDGHAPAVTGKRAFLYAGAGRKRNEPLITTDHECSTAEEAFDKIRAGMTIIIREGSAAKNLAALLPVLKKHPQRIMFCTDDAHPDLLWEHHINHHLRCAVTAGIAPLAAIRAATLNPVRHYGLKIGLLQLGDPADLAVFSDLKRFKALETYVAGKLVYAEGESRIGGRRSRALNNFRRRPLRLEDLDIEIKRKRIRAIRVIPGQLVSGEEIVPARIVRGKARSDADRDLLKLVVVNRYSATRPAIGFVRGMGLKRGAIASSVAHDSHNIVACGVRDEDILQALNLVISAKGGLSLVSGKTERILPLPIAGLMSSADAFQVTEDYRSLDRLAKKKLRSKLPAPFMTLSFLALLVIPKLKLSDRGLFDGASFSLVPLEV